jgi:AraC family ethanolamine operon transcriptional activator
VSERTLRNVFQEYFGVGPMRLLRVRQLHEIRAALLAAEPQKETVATIAARFGVWDFSQFARNYHGLYGERPSVTLRRKQPESVRRAPGPMNPTWIRYVSRRAGMEL